MTLAEFKAWFEGFTEDMEAAPTPKQWKRIKARVAQIDGVAITREVIYRDRYWPYTNTILVGGPAWSGVSYDATTATGVVSNMVDLGRAEYNQVLSS